jgi:ribosomal-protein-alanine acetyltransferase
VKQRLKQLWFRLRGKDPDAVVVTFATGAAGACRQMLEEVQRLIPGRRHFVVSNDPALEPSGAERIPVADVRSRLRPYRIGMAPVLFDGDPAHDALRRTAFLLAPTKILAYNRRLERHHLQARCWLGSLLFVCGVPLDRIWLRPRWFPWPTHDRTVVPEDPLVIEGRPPVRGKRRIAVLTPFAPFPLSHGGAVRLYHMLRSLSRTFDVYLFAFREQETPEQLKPLLEFCTAIGLVSKPRYREPRWSTLLPPEVREYESKPMRRLIERMRVERRIELVQVEFTQLARYPGDVLVEHDVTYDLYWQIHRREQTRSSWWDWWRWRRFERRAIRRFRQVVTMSAKDARMLAAPHVKVIPNGVDIRRFHPAPEPVSHRLLFIGSFRHFPNLTAFRFFLDEVWPIVHERLPDLDVTVVAGPDPEVYWRAMTGTALPSAAGIELLAFVPDVRPLYERSNVVLVPTLVSAGTNVKVLEAMAMQRAIVSTTSGCGGIDVRDGEHLLIADGAEAFAAAILRLLGDAALRRRLALAARLKVEELYDWDKLGDMQCSLVEQLLPDRVLIREGSASDVEGVRAIQREALPSSKWDAEHYLRHEFYVALLDGVLAGFIVARNTAPDEREILNIAVTPAHRGKGIGERLLRRLLYSGRPGEVFLEVRESNIRAQELYRRIGFEVVGRRPNYYDDPPETAVIMRILPVSPLTQ